MKSAKKVKLDLTELRSIAKSRAMLLAENRGINPDAIRRMTDTDYGEQCFVVHEDEAHAVIVYDREPEVTHIIRNRPGRLQPISTEQTSG